MSSAAAGTQLSSACRRCSATACPTVVVVVVVQPVVPQLVVVVAERLAAVVVAPLVVAVERLVAAADVVVAVEPLVVVARCLDIYIRQQLHITPETSPHDQQSQSAMYSIHCDLQHSVNTVNQFINPGRCAFEMLHDQV